MRFYPCTILYYIHIVSYHVPSPALLLVVTWPPHDGDQLGLVVLMGTVKNTVIVRSNSKDNFILPVHFKSPPPSVSVSSSGRQRQWLPESVWLVVMRPFMRQGKGLAPDPERKWERKGDGKFSSSWCKCHFSDGDDGGGKGLPKAGGLLVFPAGVWTFFSPIIRDRKFWGSHFAGWL